MPGMTYKKPMGGGMARRPGNMNRKPPATFAPKPFRPKPVGGGVTRPLAPSMGKFRPKAKANSSDRLAQAVMVAKRKQMRG